MRLAKIKLSGFKSFVDPTTLSLPDNLTGIVGPNGCGKSNIIDAINWVMGESSAKHLRGDSMADVIFNGSNTRKPVGQASVEIVFDNSDGALGGQYAAYGEIAIKRAIGRDGQSSYWLNGVRCRRKDITDMFLGTGLGARGYSVIEQGMVSRVVEAKPEDLRAFLEEAAGISRYKERRRETETRMRHTRENLERLSDIREELGKQLAHLERQSKAAEKYKELKAEERRQKARLLGVRWRALDRGATGLAAALRQSETETEEAVAALRAVEAAIARLREEQAAGTEAFNAAQTGFYQAAGEVARLEQAIRHAEERIAQLRRDIEQSRQDGHETARHLEADDSGLRAIRELVAAAAPELARAQTEERAAFQEADEREQGMQAWQQAWDDFNARAAEAARAQRIQELRLEGLEQGLAEGAARAASLRAERETLDPRPIADEIVALESRLAEAQARGETAATEEEACERREREVRSAIDAKSAELDATRQRQQVLRARIASLEALRQASAAADAETVGAWLEARGLAQAPRLARELMVAPGWELGLEAALRVPLDALCVADVDAALPGDTEPPGGRVTLVGRAGTGGEAWQPRAGVALQSHVRAHWPVEELLAGIYAAESTDAARALRTHLRPGECVVSRDGTVFGRGWIRLPSATAAADSVLKRERELQELLTDAESIQRGTDALVAELGALREEGQGLGSRRAAAASSRRAAQEEGAVLRSTLATRRAHLEHVTERGARVEAELVELDDDSSLTRDDLDAAHRQLTALRLAATGLEDERGGLEARRDALRAQLQEARERWRAARDQVHAVTLRSETLRSQAHGLEKAMDRHRELARQLEGRAAELTRGLEEQEPALARARGDLERALRVRVEAEGRLGDARTVLERLDAELRAREQARGVAEDLVAGRREAVERLRVESRGLQVRLQDLDEQLAAEGFARTEVVDGLEPDVDEDAVREALEGLERRIGRLGPINLAAIDEFTQLGERKTYLDSQHADLTEALTTLEEAIRRIDRETRTRFKETYDKVNSGFQQVFPVLFGGGHAYLEMTGTDLLETGISLMARPPGKRNSTIHLLSGGEKALTAFALIVAIFELNPAPFCLLDEVDAPLDDANVLRFCDLLRSMAGRVQFIFVSHNKITMEIAGQLIGVTMQEPGVSRLVTVNMEEAVQMVATA